MAENQTALCRINNHIEQLRKERDQGKPLPRREIDLRLELFLWPLVIRLIGEEKSKHILTDEEWIILKQFNGINDLFLNLTALTIAAFIKSCPELD